MGLFHITTREAWDAAKRAGEYRPPSLEAEGFIHLSEDRQLLPSAERHFAGQAGLLVLSLHRDRLTAEVRYEEVHGDRFPHLYGALDLDAVVEVFELPLGDDGRFHVPAELRPWATYFGRPEETDFGGPEETDFGGPEEDDPGE